MQEKRDGTTLFDHNLKPLLVAERLELENKTKQIKNKQKIIDIIFFFNKTKIFIVIKICAVKYKYDWFLGQFIV